MNNDYPKWKYHAEKPAVIVNSEEEEKDLGRGWKDEVVKGNTEVDSSVSQDPSADHDAPMTGDAAFEKFLDENGMDMLPAKYHDAFRKAYDHQFVNTGTTPQIEYGHPVGPQDEVVMVDSEAARKALLKQAQDMGVDVHHKSSSKTIQSAIDAHTAVKSSTPAAAKALPKDTDVAGEE